MIVLLHGFPPPTATKSLYTPENSFVGLEDEPFFFGSEGLISGTDLLLVCGSVVFLFLKKLLDAENFRGKESHLENLHVLEETLYFDKKI